MMQYPSAEAELASAAFLALAFTFPALAIDAHLATQVSRDGISWYDRLDVYPSEQVIVRLQVRAANLDFVRPMGLAGVTTQPTLSGWTAGDTRLPFSTPNGTGVDEFLNDQYGRVAPFSSSGMRSDSASGLLTSFVDPGGVLRFAGANAPTMTTNVAWGVSTGQLPLSIAGDTFHWGVIATVFRYAIRLDPELSTERSLVASVPLESVVQRRASYYWCGACTSSLLAPVRSDTIFPAVIHVVPAGSSAIALAGSAVYLWRRRRTRV